MKKFTIAVLSLVFLSACATKPYEGAQCVDELVMPIQTSTVLLGLSTAADASAEPTFCFEYR